MLRLDKYATHLEPLIRAAVEARKGILELGCGNYSTPILREISASKGIPFLCQASDISWAAQFDGVQIVDWTNWSPPAGSWDVVFLDSEEATKDRIRRLPVLAKFASIVVMHDADAAMAHPWFNECVSAFPKSDIYKKHRPWTMTLYA